MEKHVDGLQNKNIFKIILGGASILSMVIFIIVVSVLAAYNLRNKNNIAIEVPSEVTNVLAGVHVVSGKIVDIQDKTVFLETPVFDIVKKGWDMNKKEVRKLTASSETRFFKNSWVWSEEKQEMKSIVDTATFADLKIGDFIDAKYTENLVEVKDFSPKIITILSN